jgi:hypothetical protein
MKPCLSWPERYRAAVARSSAQNGRDAERREYGRMLNEWHATHGKRHDPSRCAGCGKHIVGSSRIVVFEKGVVHLGGDNDLDCLIQYGETWRGEAKAGLSALGVFPPSGWS